MAALGDGGAAAVVGDADDDAVVAADADVSGEVGRIDAVRTRDIRFYLKQSPIFKLNGINNDFVIDN